MKTSSLIPLSAALALFAAISSAGAADLKALYQQARVDFSAGRYAEAKGKLEKVLAAAPDLVPARAMLAEIALKERERAARPASLKIAESTPMGEVPAKEVTVMEAFSIAQQQIEKAGGGPDKAPSGLLPQISKERQDARLSVEAKGLTIQQFVDAVAWAGGVKVSYQPAGIVVLPRDGGSLAAGSSSAAPASRTAAQQILVPRVRFEDAGVEEVTGWLRRKAAEGSPGKAPPVIMVRRPVAEKGVTLDLRNQTLHDALHALALVSDVVVEYHDWGIGVAPAETAGGRSSSEGATLPPGNAAPPAADRAVKP